MQLTLLRHPPVSAAGICYGRTEVRLAAGHTKDIARALADTPRPVRLLTSPARRCRALAGALSTAHGIEAEVDPRLQELDFGAWEGRPWTAIPRQESDPWAEDLVNRAPPGGESFAQLSNRVEAAARAAPGATLITHAGPIRALIVLSGQMDFDVAFATRVPYATPIRLTL